MDRRNCLNRVKVVYGKHTANLRLNGDKLKEFSLKSGIRQGYLLWLLLVNIALKPSPDPLDKKKVLNQIVKEDVKLYLIIDNMILYVENRKDYTSTNKT